MTDIWADVSTVKAAFKQWPEIFDDEFVGMLSLIAEIMATETAKFTPVGAGTGPLGHMSNSIQAGETVPTSRGWAAPWGTAAEHGEVIEHGRRPGGRMPPIDAIIHWVWDKRYVFPDVKTEKDAKSLAFVIARSIAAKGFTSAPDGHGKGWGMFEKGLEAGKPYLDDIVSRAKQEINRRCTEAAA